MVKAFAAPLILMFRVTVSKSFLGHGWGTVTLWLLNSAYTLVAFSYWPSDESKWRHWYLNEYIVQHGLTIWNYRILKWKRVYWLAVLLCLHCNYVAVILVVHVEILMISSFFFHFRSLLRTLMVQAVRCGYWAHQWRAVLLPLHHPPRTPPRQRNGHTSGSSSSRWSRPFRTINNRRPIESFPRPSLKQGKEERKISHVSWVPSASRLRPRSTTVTRRAAPSPKSRTRVPRAHELWRPQSPNKRLKLGKTSVKFYPHWYLMCLFDCRRVVQVWSVLIWSAWVLCVMVLISFVFWDHLYNILKCC